MAMPSVMVVDEFGFRTRIRRFRLRKRSSDMMKKDSNCNLNNTKNAILYRQSPRTILGFESNITNCFSRGVTLMTAITAVQASRGAT